MSRHTLVCPYDGPFLTGFSGQSIVVCMDDTEQVVNAAEAVKPGNKLHAICLSFTRSLAELPVKEAWKGIPLAVHLPRLGSFRQVANKLHLLHALDICIFLPDDQGKENYTSLRILSSLGIRCGLAFNHLEPDWNALNDLAYYALYGRSAHAHIEPFHFIRTMHKAEQRLDFGAVYFDDPKRYLHLNSRGKVALSKQDLAAGNYILEYLTELETISELPTYKRHLESWRQHFLKEEGCAYCAAWRVCLGRLSDITRDHKACGALFSELMDAAESYQKKKVKEKNGWRF